MDVYNSPAELISIDKTFVQSFSFHIVVVSFFLLWSRFCVLFLFVLLFRCDWISCCQSLLNSVSSFFRWTATLLNPPPSPYSHLPLALCRNSADLNWRVRPKCFNCPSPGNWCPDRQGRSPQGPQRARETSLTPPRLETINTGHRLQFNRISRWRSAWDRSGY